VHHSLSVVICAYTLDRWGDIEAAVASLQRQERRPDQVVLVADHNPELLDRSRAAFPDVTVLPNAGPRGLSGARNTGVEAATGDVVAFLDDDAAADPLWTAQLLEAFAAADDVIGVGGWVEPDWRAPRPAWFPDEFLWVVGSSYAGLPTGRAEIRNPIGANMSFRRSVLDSAGGFDPDMGRSGADAAGCEETEFAIRARSLTGGRVVLEPDASCRHKVTPERVTRTYFRRRCRAEGRSKAVVSTLAGQDAALESERGYVLRTLPRGVVRGLVDVLRGDRGGAARAWAIVEGTALTAVSYALARLRARRA
jgi:glucosyl-dolichyl phosphate glucuronosyltransferase